MEKYKIDHAGKALLFSFVFLFSINALSGNTSVDIRSNNTLRNNQDTVEYTAYFSDCSQLVSVRVGSGLEAVTYSSSDFITADTGCELPFNAYGNDALNPQLELTFADGSVQTYTKVRTAPSSNVYLKPA